MNLQDALQQLFDFRTMQPRRLNYKLLLALLVAVAVIGGGVHFLHAFQTRRNAEAFLVQGQLAEAADRKTEAANYFFRYLALNPGDNEVRRRYAALIDDLAADYGSRMRALSLLESVLSRNEQDHEIRRRAARTALAVGRFRDADSHLQTLRAALPADVEVTFLIGISKAGQGKADEAEKDIRLAVKQDPAKIDYALNLATLLRERLNKPEEAIQVIDAMVAANPESVEAHLARVEFLRGAGLLSRAVDSLARARALAPEDLRVLLASAQAELELAKQGDLHRAQEYLTKAMLLHPKEPRVYQALATLEQTRGQRSEAIAVLRRGIRELPTAWELQLALAEMLVQNNNHDEAGRIIGQLREKGVFSAQLDFLQARLLYAAGNWGEAATLLENARVGLERFPDLARQAEILLGMCYDRSGDTDRQIVAYRRALQARPGSSRAEGALVRLQLVNSLLTVGRLSEAQQECRLVLSEPDHPPQAWVMLARVLLMRTLQVPLAQRDWKEVNQALDRAQAVLPDSSDVVLLRAEALVAQGRRDQARALLEKARAAKPTQLAYWSALAALHAREGQPEQAQELLRQARERLGDTAEVRLAQIRFWSRRKAEEARAALTELAQAMEKFEPAVQVRLREELAQAHFVHGNLAEAKRLWEQLAVEEPTNLRVYLALLEIAVRENSPTAGDLVNKVRSLDGEEGAVWRYAEAFHLLAQVRRGEKHRLEEARGRLTDVINRRPTWARAVLLEAELHELEGNPNKALESYLRAVKLGETHPRVLRRTVNLLLERRRAAEAAQILKDLQDRDALGAETLRLAAEVALNNKEPDRALELARQAVSAQSSDYRDHVWLSRFYEAAKQPAQAEAALRRATDLAGPVPEAWMARVLYLARNGQRAQAEAVLTEAGSKLSAEQAPLALAACHEALGRHKQAEELYLKVQADNPYEPAPLVNLANYYLRIGRGALAEPYLRRLLTPEVKSTLTDVRWARRRLAVILASTGTYAHFREAVKLLDENLAQAGSAEDLRTKAVVLATRQSRRKEALELLVRSETTDPLLPDEQYLLAQLYETNNDWPKAREQFESLLRDEPRNPAHVARYVELLLRHEETGAARIWIDRLKQLEPDSVRTIALEIRLLHGLNRGSAALNLLQEFSRKASPADLARVGTFLERLSMPELAEELYRAYASQSGRAEAGLLLAGYLARRNRLSEALDVLDGAWRSCPPELVASASIEVLYQARLNPEQSQRVERAVDAALKRDPTSITLQLALAVLRDFYQGRAAEALQLYRKVLEREPRNIMSLNNAALLVALHEARGTEALALIEKALSISGPGAALLDTRGVVYLSMGRVEEAIKDFQEAIDADPTPYRLFHLAQAYLDAGNRSLAVQTLTRARQAGLKPDIIHPVERPIYQKLVLTLGGQR